MILLSEFEHLSADLKAVFTTVPLNNKKRPAWLVTSLDGDRGSFEKFLKQFTHDRFLRFMEPVGSQSGHWVACVFYDD